MVLKSGENERSPTIYLCSVQLFFNEHMWLPRAQMLNDVCKDRKVTMYYYISITCRYRLSLPPSNLVAMYCPESPFFITSVGRLLVQYFTH